MDCLVQHPHPHFWTGVMNPHNLPSYSSRNYFSNFYFPRKRQFNAPYYPGNSLFYPTDDEVDYPADIKGELTTASTTPYSCVVDDSHDFKVCVVCGERASGFYFGALVCLPCKSFYIRCTKDGEPVFTCQCSGNCDIAKQGRIRCQYCRYQRCLMAGMCRKEKPETVQPAEGQVLCKVCGDIANGIHFGVNTCEGCKKFFRRGLVENQSYLCKGEKDCGINPRNRNNCRYCRYQKCLAVGMSREAIKMGRPKKADGPESICSLSNGAKLLHQSSVEHPDNVPSAASPSCSQNGVSSPQSSGSVLDERTDSNDALEPPASNMKIKVENERQSCKYEEQSNNTTNNNGSLSQHPSGQRSGGHWLTNGGSKMTWHQSGSVPPTSCYNSGTPTTQTTGTATSTEFIEEEMDEILMLLQNDNNNNSSNKNNNQQTWSEGAWKGNKKMRGYNYCIVDSDKPHKTEPQFCASSPPNQQWAMPAQGSMTNMQPMNMSTNRMSPRQPPPQYPGSFQGDYQQDQMTCVNQNHPMGIGSPCGSPKRHVAHSPGYATVENPAIGSPLSINPMENPSCQYSSSPQHSPYHSDSSPMGSPYTKDMYTPNHSYNQPSPAYHQPHHITDLSVNVNVNCNPASMSSHSPQGSPHQYPTSPMAQSPGSTLPMTIPNQEVNCTTTGSWSGSQGNQSPPHYHGSPMSSSCPSNIASSPATIPHQEGSCLGIQQGSQFQTSYVNLENLQRINQYFTMTDTNTLCRQRTLELVDDKELHDGAVTRSDIERDVVMKTLQTVSPSESYFYVMSDTTYTSDGNTSSSSYDEFTSCRRLNKRKSFDDPDECESPRSLHADFQVGRYKRHMTEMYWKKTVHVEENFTMTTDKQALLEHLTTTYNQMSQHSSDANNLANSQGKQWVNISDDSHHWEMFQNRNVKNTEATVKFAAQIPGFSSIHPEDKTFLCKNVAFMSSVLMAGHEMYNPAEKSFCDFWNLKINQSNPLYHFQQSLLQLAERISAANMDMYEVASLSALLYVATDFLDLAYPEAIEGARRKIIGALQSYELSKGVDVQKRLSSLFNLVPEIRHIGAWHLEMSKQIKVNSQLQEVHQHFNTINL